MKKYALVAAIILAAPLFAFCSSTDSGERTATTAPNDDSETATTNDAEPTAANDAEPTATEAPRPTETALEDRRVGVDVKAGDSLYRINAIIDAYDAGEFFGPEPGNRFFVMDITQTGIEDGSSYNSFDFSLQTTDDFVWECSGFGGLEPGFSIGELHQGQRVRGYVTCEIAEDATVATVLVDPSFFGSAVVIADLSLGTDPVDPYPTGDPLSGPPVGELTQSGNSSYRINAVIDDYDPGEFFEPEPGNRMFVFDVTQTGTEDGASYNSFDFYVQTVDDFIWSCSSFGGPEPGFPSGELQEGDRVRGYLACAIGEDATVAVILIEPDFLEPRVVLADPSRGADSVGPYPASDPITGPAVGESTESGGSRYTVNAIDDGYSGGSFGPDPGQRIIAIDVTQEGLEDGDEYSSFSFYLQTTDDFFYDCTGFSIPDPDFPSGNLAVGQKVRGWIGCEIQEDATIAAIWAETETFGPAVVIAVP